MLWKLPYHYAKMSLEKAAGPEPVIAYETNRIWPGPTPASCTVTYRPAGTPSPAQTGTLEHFLVERYILYAARNKHLYQGRVHHKPYPLQQAEVLSLEEDLIDALRIFRPDAAPLAHYASEVSVDVYPLRKIS
jgi:uncharacterized protein YqjF (DUF2071 family)